MTLMDNGTADTSLEVSIVDSGSLCDTSGTVDYGTSDTWSIRIVEDGSTSCGSNSRFGCVVRGTIP